MNTFKKYMKSLVKDEAGQSMVEYGLILALVALVIAAAFPTLTDAVSALFDRVAASL